MVCFGSRGGLFERIKAMRPRKPSDPGRTAVALQKNGNQAFGRSCYGLGTRIYVAWSRALGLGGIS